MPKDIQTSLDNLRTEPVATLLFSRLLERDILEVADIAYDLNEYQCKYIALEALSRILPNDASIERRAREHVRYLFLVAWRLARRTTGTLAERADWQILGRRFLDETSGQAVILLTPMMLPLLDVLEIVNISFKGRQIIFYGERLDTTKAEALSSVFKANKLSFARMGSGGVKEILRCMNKGGVFCTYPDFVYDGHKAVAGMLFGQRRPFSRSFMKLCRRPGACILPVRIDCVNRNAEFLEPILLDFPGDLPRRVAERSTIDIVCRLMEELIRLSPECWLLLGTLHARCEQAPRAF